MYLTGYTPDGHNIKSDENSFSGSSAVTCRWTDMAEPTGAFL
jgi:hypothetical protein